MRNYHLALMLSQGTPMLLMGARPACCHPAFPLPAAGCRRAWLLPLQPLLCSSFLPLPLCPASCQPPPLRLLPSQPSLPFLAGDEYGQSRQGNNNYYGHDTPLTHYHWDQLEQAKQNGWFR